MNPNKALWEKGDFTRIAASMRESGEALVEELGITKGLRSWISDAATERRRCPRRSSARTCWASTSRATSSRPETGAPGAWASPTCRFQEGDASDLHELEDDSFDLVVSIFGAMFAPKPFDVAKEMVRVTRPGGRIVMGNWIPNDPTLVAQILKISSAYSPPPPEGFVSPMTWGVEEQRDRAIRRRGSPEGEDLVRPGHLHSTSPARRRSSSLTFRTYYGPTMNAFEAPRRTAARRTPGGAGSAVRRPEQEPEQGRHLDSCNLPARDGYRLRRGR